MPNSPLLDPELAILAVTDPEAAAAALAEQGIEIGPADIAALQALTGGQFSQEPPPGVSGGQAGLIGSVAGKIKGGLGEIFRGLPLPKRTPPQQTTGTAEIPEPQLPQVQGASQPGEATAQQQQAPVVREEQRDDSRERMLRALASLATPPEARMPSPVAPAAGRYTAPTTVQDILALSGNRNMISGAVPALGQFLRGSY